jgi:Tol biopolymer transport system component
MRRLIPIFALAIAALWCQAAGHHSWPGEPQEQKPRPVSPCSADFIFSEMFSYYPVPIGVSSDGMRILEQARPSGSEDTTLLVLNVPTQKIVRKLEWKGPVVHLSWRPDGWSISFFSRDAGTNLRRLFVWSLRDGTVRLIRTPQTSNQPLVRWSPDGSKLAFAQEFRAIVIVTADGSGEPVIYPGHYSMFAWSADSRQLALVPDDQSHQVIIADASSPRVLRRVTTHTSGKVLDVAWQPRTTFLMLLETKEGIRYLNAYDAGTETERVLYSAKADLRSPAWLPPGHGFLFNRNTAGVSELFLGSEQAGIEPRPLVSGGSANFLSLFPDGKAIAVTYRGEASIQVMKVFLYRAGTEMLASARLSALAAIRPKKISVTSFDGMKIPILLWESPLGQHESRSVVIRVHANLESPEMPLWQEDIQTYLKHGVDFMGVNYRGTAGFGIDFQNAGDTLARARDVVAACEYAHISLRIPYDRIVVLAHSNGAKIALEAALLAPHRMGMLVLVSLPGVPVDWMKYRDRENARPRVILGIHGEKDAMLSPLRGRALIEKVFGPDALGPTGEHWFVIPDETHVLEQDRSWAFVHATILRQLRSPLCAVR